MSKKGFTLLEVLIVVVIAVSVAAFAVPVYKKTQEKARYNAAAGFLVQLGGAVKNLRDDLEREGLTRTFPTSSSATTKVTVNVSWSKSSTTTYKNVRDKADLSELTSNSLLGYALVAREYMSPFPFTALPYNGYNFYICSQKRANQTSVTALAGDCCSFPGVVACMVGADSSSEYYYGRYLNSGVVVRGKETVS